jgi:hypothetical protein
MKPRLAGVILAVIFAAGAFAAVQGPEVLNIDQKISIRADSIPLDYLLRLLDQATGMHSTVPPDLAKRVVSVRFTGLSVGDAVRKIFENQPLNYVFVEGEGIVVTGFQSRLAAAPAPAQNNEPQAIAQPAPQKVPEPMTQPLRQKPSAPQPPIPTPFGPTWIPSGNQMVQLPPVPGAPTPSFFAPQTPAAPPAGAANGPTDNTLFGPLPIYQSPPVPQPNSRQPGP